MAHELSSMKSCGLSMARDLSNVLGYEMKYEMRICENT